MKDLESKARRRFLTNLAAAGVALPLMRIGVASAKSLPHVDPSSSTAKALKYTNDFKTAAKLDQHKKGAHCGDCMFYQGGDSKWGACPMFPGHDVHIDGWCTAWSAKPS